MDKELIQILLLTQGGFLFALGGWKWKGWRRFIMPVVTGVLLSLYSVVFWKCILAGVILLGVTHLPYGKNNSFFERFLVGGTYVLPSFVLGLTWWALITPIVFEILFELSNWKETEKDFTWKVVEFLIGVCIQATIIGALSRPW